MTLQQDSLEPGAAGERQSAPQFEPGVVVSYVPNNTWCREGTAIADDRGRLVDTYWTSGNDVLSEAEAASAVPLFNLRDYREVGPSELRAWEGHHPDDRQVITSQHRLRRRLFLRVGAKPDHTTQIENARQAVREGEDAVGSAERTLKMRREYLAYVENGSAS